MTTTTNGTVATRDAQDVAAQSATLAIRPGQEFWTREQRAALSVLGIRNASNADLAVFMHYCQRTGLDPFSRQIYGIMRREKQGDQWVDKFTIQVGIDGFRVIRDRIEQRQGVAVEYEDTTWYDADGQPHDVWLSPDPPAACRVVLLKNGRRFPAVLRTAAYMATKDGRPVSQWRTQPDHMIEKCCEAFALRRAFPNDLGGIYLEEEMDGQPVPQPPQRVTRAEVAGRGTTQEPAAGVAPPDHSSTGPGRPSPVPEGAPSPPPQHNPAQPVPKAQSAGKAALDKLTALAGQLSLDSCPDADVLALYEWVAGAPWTATRAQVQAVCGYLDDHLKTAQGDADQAFAAIWRQYREQHPAGEATGAS